MFLHFGHILELEVVPHLGQKFLPDCLFGNLCLKVIYKMGPIGNKKLQQDAMASAL